MARGDLTDPQWERLEPLLPPVRSGKKGRPYRDHRPVLDGILWVLRTGAAWEDLPDRYPPKSTCHDRLARWQRDGTWTNILQALLAAADAHGDLAWVAAFVDSTTVRAHQHAAGARRTPAQVVVRRKRGGRAGCWGGPRPQPGRADHQDPPCGRGERAAARRSADARAAA
jgi:transposase